VPFANSECRLLASERSTATGPRCLGAVPPDGPLPSVAEDFGTLSARVGPLRCDSACSIAPPQ
jgi:hypothetical protein